jgi:hypothetical protein
VIPDWFEFILLALIAFRFWRLLAEDDILEHPRRWFLRLPYEWKDGPFPKEYREKWALFLICPWCAGAWVSLLTYIAFLGTLGEWPDTFGDVAVGLGVWFALSASVGLIRTNLDPPEDDE